VKNFLHHGVGVNLIVGSEAERLMKRVGDFGSLVAGQPALALYPVQLILTQRL
jgi:hypothetical protein